MAQRFTNIHVSRAHFYALGRDEQTGERYLSIPVSNRLVDYEEYYRLDPAEFDTFMTDEGAAQAFAEVCRARGNDERLILKPGTDRGSG